MQSNQNGNGNGKMITNVFLFLIVLFASPVFAEPVTIAWDNVEFNTDGTPATAISYRLYIGCDDGELTYIDVGNVTQYTYDQQNIIQCYQVTAYDTAGKESDYSGAIVRVLGNLSI